MTFVKLTSFMLILLLVSGCCTIMLSPEQDVGITSNPSGAKITIDGKEVGNTPMTTSLARKNAHSIKIQLDGYMPYEIHLTKNTSSWVFGNIIFGGLIGLVVDMATGALYELTPDQVQANLIKSDTGMKNEDTLYIAFTMIPDPKWKKIGNLTKMDK